MSIDSTPSRSRRLLPHLLHVLVELRLADDRRDEAVRAERDGSHLPVADVAGHEQETPAPAADALEDPGVLDERRDARHERLASQLPDVDRVAAVLEELRAGQRLRFRLGDAEGHAEVVPDPGLRSREEPDGEAVSDEVDGVQHRHRQPARAVVQAAVDDAVRETVADPLLASARRRRRGDLRGFSHACEESTIQASCHERPPDPPGPRQRTIRARAVLSRRAAGPRVRGRRRFVRGVTTPTIVDLRFGHSVRAWARRTRPRRGRAFPACTRSSTTGSSRRRGRSAASSPDAFILVGGHAAAAFPGPLEAPEIDAVVRRRRRRGRAGRGRRAGRAAGRLPRCPALRLRDAGRLGLDAAARGADRARRVPLPARDLVERDRNRYHCLLFKPVWLVETARGCPFRCSFCSVWQLYGRSFRERSDRRRRRGLRADGRLPSSSPTTSSGTTPSAAASSRAR